MTHITLPPELEESLCEAAQRRGTTAEVFAIDAIRQAVGQAQKAEQPIVGVAAEKQPKNLYEYLTSIIEPVHGSSEPMAENHSEIFAEGMFEKWRRGKL